MYQELLDDWAEIVNALQIAAKLNPEIETRLLAQAEGYTLAINVLVAEGKSAASELSSAISSLQDSIKYLQAHNEFLEVLINTLSICQAAINRATPQEAT